MYLKSAVFCLWWLLFLDTKRSFVTGAIRQVEERKILNEILNETIYDKNVRPFSNSINGNGSTNVFVNMYVRNMNMESVDVKNREYTLQLTLRQEWMDERLQFSDKLKGLEDGINLPFLTMADPSKIWIPDLFFSNDNAAYLHNLMTPNLYIRISPNGTVLYSAKITLKLFCVFIFKRFPFDSQTCSMRIASYGYTDKDVMFHWHGINPVQLTSNLHNNHFSMNAYETHKCDSETRTGIYSCLRVDFFFKRELRTWMETVYMPTSIIVLVAWLGCWLDDKFILARVVIGLSSLFVLMSEISKLNDFVIPKLSYSTAITPWTDACMGFVLATIVEFMLVTLIARMQMSSVGSTANGNKRDDEEVLVNRFEMEDRPATSPQLGLNISYRVGKWFLNLSISRKCDILFGVLYPIVFLCFACIYLAYWSTDCGSGLKPPESQLC